MEGTSCGLVDAQGAAQVQINYVDMRQELLEENESYFESMSKCRCPEIEISLQGIDVKALYDTGSEITCIDEKFYLNNIRFFNKCPKIPMNGKIAKGALGGKSPPIKFQILCDVKFANNSEKIIVIVVPKLGRNAIIGYDTINDLKLLLNPSEKKIISQVKGYEIFYNLSNQNNDCTTHIVSINFGEEKVEGQEHQQERRKEELSFEKIKNKIANNDNLNENECRKLADTIFKYKKIFRSNPGLIKNFEYHLRVKSNEPFFVRPYPIPIKYQDKVDAEIQKMIENNIIQRSMSNFINPIVIVPKKDGSIRLCLDARELNRRLEDDRESPPGIDEIFKKCESVKFLSSLDLTASFWQIKLAEKDRKYTAFMVNGKVYEFKVVPFGLKIATSALLRALDLSLSNLKFILRFVDDMLVLSKNFD